MVRVERAPGCPSYGAACQAPAALPLGMGRPPRHPLPEHGLCQSQAGEVKRLELASLPNANRKNQQQKENMDTDGSVIFSNKRNVCLGHTQPMAQT